MTKKCSICATENDDNLTFCESCGSPLETTEAKLEKIPEIEFGFASSFHEGEENKDSLLIMDTKTLFGEAKQRRVLCILGKGRGRTVDVKYLSEKLIEKILTNQDTDYESLFLEIRNQMENEDDNSVSEDSEMLKMGLLVGIIKNAKIDIMCLNDTRVLALKHENDGLGIIENHSDDGVFSLSLETIDYLCMFDNSLIDIVSEEGVLEVISKTNSTQSACDKIVSIGKEIDPESDFSLMLIKRIN